MKWIIALVIVSLAGLSFGEGSADHSGHDYQGTFSEQSVQEDTYTCPMHPNIKQNEPGSCPICGMDLVKVKKPVIKEEPKGKVYTCPMHPNIKQDEPGTCPICGMDLVPMKQEQSASMNGLTIDPATRKIAGIATETLHTVDAMQSIKAVGTLDFDESRIATISAYVDGRLEKLYADYTGVKVNKEEHLAELYSPSLYSAQVEYLQALSGGSGGLQKQLISGAKQKLGELGMTKAQIRKLKRSQKAQSRMTLNSPVGGTVILKKAHEGSYVKTGQVIYKVADLSTIWLLLDLYPEEASHLRHGLKVTIKVDSRPNEPYHGRISFISPVVDPKKRTVRVRVEIPNDQGKLRPGEYASARIMVPIRTSDSYFDPDLAGKWIAPMHPQHIHDKPGKCPVCGMNMVPAESLGFAKEPPTETGVVTVARNTVLMMGDKRAVYVEDPENHFSLREITTGVTASDGRLHVLSGLSDGESVATEGVFLLDSQMQLSGKTSLVDITGKKPVDPHAGHNH